jgi:hypothetical protein
MNALTSAALVARSPRKPIWEREAAMLEISAEEAASMASPELTDKLHAAFKRRMGEPRGALSVALVSKGRHRVTDAAGSWVEFDTTWWRIRRLAEHKAA